VIIVILKIYISQSTVSTQLRCGGMFSNHFITNFPQTVLVEKFWKSVNVWRRYGQQFAAYFFGPPYSFDMRGAPLEDALIR